VLLDPTKTAGRRALFDPATAGAALRSDDLLARGVPEPRFAALEDVVVRAALISYLRLPHVFCSPES
jgi:hypothetical protein